MQEFPFFCRILQQMNVRNFLIQHELIKPYDLPTSTGQFRINCLECHHHGDKMYVSAEGKGVKCFHCGHGEGWRTFVRRFEPPSPEEKSLEQFVKASELFLWKNDKVLQYLKDRGLNEQTIKAARLGYWSGKDYKPLEVDVKIGLARQSGDWFLDNCITIPYIEDNIVYTVRGRKLNLDLSPSDENPKYLTLPNSGAHVYHPPGKVSYETPVVVTEGEFDALIVDQVGCQAIGVPGANIDVASYVSSFSKIYVAYDSDKAGRTGSRSLISKLNEAYEVDLPEATKDVSEYIQKYGEHSFNNLLTNARFYVQGKEQQDDSLARSIELWEDWAWSNGELLGPKIKWAPRFEAALSGWSRGLFLVGALPNSGKSCFFVKSAYECAKDNPDDTLVVYLSLDDDQEDAISRLVSLHTGVSFELIRSPRFSFDNPLDASKRNPKRLAAFNEAIGTLKEIDNLIFRDARYGRSLQYIRTFLASLRKRAGDKHITVFVDSLAKVTAENEPVNIAINNWKAHLATELKYLSTLYDMNITTPADFRKLNDERRPTNDDLKDASELAYEANCTLLGFNELHVKGDAERTILKWRDNEGNTWPIFEMNVSKNKKSLYKGAIRFRFMPKTSDFQELTEQEDNEFNRIIRTAEATKKTQKTGYFENRSYVAEPVPAGGIFDNKFTGPSARW